MNPTHTYQITVTWTGNKGQGTGDYRSYERSHTLSIANKPEILCSSDPAFQGDNTKHNPEELFVSSIATCHMLWYLHLCAEAGVVVISYLDNATGIMKETKDGGGHFTNVTLNPVVVVSDKAMIAPANELHEKANELCFIANSCNFKINHQPTCTVND